MVGRRVDVVEEAEGEVEAEEGGGERDGGGGEDRGEEIGGGD